VRELKARPGRELQVHGSGVLLRWLLERDLVDELNLRLYPVVSCTVLEVTTVIRRNRTLVDGQG
jgi:riboflavin biosynthesis pyrimidine reductase